MKKKKILALSVLAISTTLVLSACGPNRLLESAEDVDEKKNSEDQEQNQLENEYQEQIKKWEETYANPEKTVEETVESFEKEKVGDVINIDLVKRDKYTDPREMAKFVSQQLFDFNNGDLSPEAYIAFLKQYGSPHLLEGSLTLDEKADIDLIKTIQQRMLDTDVKYESYSISTPNVSGDEVVFYRKMITTDGRTVYNITTLFKNTEGVLLFDNDDNSVPVDF